MSKVKTATAIVLGTIGLGVAYLAVMLCRHPPGERDFSIPIVSGYRLIQTQANETWLAGDSGIYLLQEPIDRIGSSKGFLFGRGISGEQAYFLTNTDEGNMQSGLSKEKLKMLLQKSAIDFDSKIEGIDEFRTQLQAAGIKNGWKTP